jgi:hypothetical protein
MMVAIECACWPPLIPGPSPPQSRGRREPGFHCARLARIGLPSPCFAERVGIEGARSADRWMEHVDR